MLHATGERNQRKKDAEKAMRDCAQRIEIQLRNKPKMMTLAYFFTFKSACSTMRNSMQADADISMPLSTAEITL